MRRRLVVVAVVCLAATGATVIGVARSSAGPDGASRVTSLQPQAAYLQVNGTTKRLPYPTSRGLSTAPAAGVAAQAVPGVSLGSLGCRARNHGQNVRVNQDCTFRRQAEEHIAYNPTDPSNLVAGMNDSLIGWNQTSLDFSLDGGKHWGAVSTAPFRFRLNAPDDLLPTTGDPNRHTLKGDPGTLHSYDACSDPYIAYDSAGRAFYTCVAFGIAGFESMVFVVPSPPNAKGSYFDQVPAPFGLTPGWTGREHIVQEDNSPAASSDGPKLAADAYAGSPNRDNVYSTFTIFKLTCGPNHDQYCSSKIYGSMSTDHGFTWSTPEEISGTSPQCVLGNAADPSERPHACSFNGHSDIAVLPNGELAITASNGNTDSVDSQILAMHCQPTGSSPAGTARLHCGSPTKAADMTVTNAPTCDFGRGPELCIPGTFIRAPVETAQRIAVDQETGDLFVTWYDYRNGEYDIFASRSSDGGATWSPARQVNPDTGTDHYFSAIDVGERGAGSQVGISYYRTDRVPNENHPPAGGFAPGQPGVQQEQSDFVLSHGSGLATPFGFDVLSPRFPAPDGVQSGFNGDYTGITVTPDNVAHPIWSDTRSAVQNPDFNHLTVDEDVFTDARPLR